MTDSPQDPQRRRALVTALATVAAVPLANGLLVRHARASDLPHLSEDDPTASALKYHHNAADAPRSKKSGVAAEDQYCHNCKFIQADSGQWRGCQIFPGKAVNAEGWCTSWMPKA